MMKLQSRDSSEEWFTPQLVSRNSPIPLAPGKCPFQILLNASLEQGLLMLILLEKLPAWFWGEGLLDGVQFHIPTSAPWRSIIRDLVDEVPHVSTCHMPAEIGQQQAEKPGGSFFIISSLIHGPFWSIMIGLPWWLVCLRNHKTNN